MREKGVGSLLPERPEGCFAQKTPDPFFFFPVEIWQAARRADVVAAMRSFHAETDRLVAAHEPICHNRGLCCRFGQFGHRLYVTALEVAYYLAEGLRVKGVRPLLPERPEGCFAQKGSAPFFPADDACPHAYDGACHARDRRFLGCRVFFCDPASRAWQGPLIEQRLACLRRLHDELHVSYFYADWIAVLAALHEGKEGIT